MKNVTLGFSTCPNDTFIFHAMLHGKVATSDFEFEPHLHDVQELNQKAFVQEYDVTKLSFYAYLKVRKFYEILDSGSALGFGCGPLLIGRTGDVPDKTARIAIPGELTTAYLLLRLWRPDLQNVVPTRFDKILPGVQSGEYDAGLIIHEGRFVYPEYGCKKIIDLGEWWESETGCPIPLGCIAISKKPGIYTRKADIDLILKSSVSYAFSHREASRTYIKQYAQELEDTVVDNHISLYVNDFTYSLGEDGRKSIEILENMATEKEIL